MTATIASVGRYLPPLRGNDWWPDDVVASWVDASGGPDTGGIPDDVVVDDGVRAVLEAMAAVANDPFRGVKTRSIMPEGMNTLEMESCAANEALERAGVRADQIDVFMQQSTANVYVSPQNACAHQATLGLRPDVLVVGVENHYDSFMMQLTLAESLIAVGRADTALLVQSSATSRLLDSTKPFAPWMGDGATAVVLTRAADGEGILGRAHRADGTFFRAYGVGGPGAAWFDVDRPQFFIEDPALLRRLFLKLADQTAETIHAAMRDADLQPTDIDFFACHQATSWLGTTLQRYSGLGAARTWNTCAELGSLAACNVPLVLREAQERGLLGPGDHVVMQSGGAGLTLSAVAMRWSC